MSLAEYDDLSHAVSVFTSSQLLDPLARSISELILKHGQSLPVAGHLPRYRQVGAHTSVT